MQQKIMETGTITGEATKTLAEKFYGERGYAICSMLYPEKLGAILEIGTVEWTDNSEYLSKTPWRIIGTATKQEWRDWLNAIGINNARPRFPHIYKIEAID